MSLEQPEVEFDGVTVCRLEASEQNNRRDCLSIFVLYENEDEKIAVTALAPVFRIPIYRFVNGPNQVTEGVVNPNESLLVSPGEQ